VSLNAVMQVTIAPPPSSWMIGLDINTLWRVAGMTVSVFVVIGFARSFVKLIEAPTVHAVEPF